MRCRYCDNFDWRNFSSWKEDECVCAKSERAKWEN